MRSGFAPNTRFPARLCLAGVADHGHARGCEGVGSGAGQQKKVPLPGAQVRGGLLYRLIIKDRGET